MKVIRNETALKRGLVGLWSWSLARNQAGEGAGGSGAGHGVDRKTGEQGRGHVAPWLVALGAC